jgi:UDP-N-acetylglucosamine 2-epimerase (non-hydrolysing)
MNQDHRTKILIVFGTRPEAIKMAPLVKQFETNPLQFEVKVCVTAQHREMLDQVMEFFNIISDYDLDLMKPNQNLYNLTSEIITNMKVVLEDFQPNYVFVHGDTTTSMAASIASFYSGAKVCHVEAGLRTHNITTPFPEEANRQIVGRLCHYHFAPTKVAEKNLIKENILPTNILVTGNTVIDALMQSLSKIKNNPSDFIQKITKILSDKDMILVTGHRRENHGSGLISICEALKDIAQIHQDKHIVFPVHLNPKVQLPVRNILGKLENVILTPPLPYEDFIWMMNRSKLIITDSGGIQEEAPSLGKPVLVMRDASERPEAIQAGTVLLVGSDKDRIVREATSILEDRERYDHMSKAHNPYGDGNASKRIVQFILDKEKKKLNKPINKEILRA